MSNYYWDEFSGVNNSQMGRYLTQIEIEFIQKFLNKNKLKNILEIGCGSGRLTTRIIPELPGKFSYTATDIDPVPLKLLKERVKNIKIIPLDASKPLPFKDNSYDCILAIEFLDYLTDLDSFFKECQRVLVPGGHVVFTCGNAASYKRHLQKMFGRHKGRYLFATSDIRNNLKKSGFTLTRIKGFNWLPFRRESNSPLIPIFAHFEKYLGLANLHSISPWVIYEARSEKN